MFEFDSDWTKLTDIHKARFYCLAAASRHDDVSTPYGWFNCDRTLMVTHPAFVHGIDPPRSYDPLNPISTQHPSEALAKCCHQLYTYYYYRRSHPSHGVSVATYRWHRDVVMRYLAMGGQLIIGIKGDFDDPTRFDSGEATIDNPPSLVIQSGKLLVVRQSSYYSPKELHENSIDETGRCEMAYIAFARHGAGCKKQFCPFGRLPAALP